MELEDAYAVLGLKQDASEGEVRRAYRRLLMAWHPDRFAGGDPQTQQRAQERTIEVVKAYAAIREHLRVSGTAAKRATQASPVARPAPTHRFASPRRREDPVDRAVREWLSKEKTTIVLLVGLMVGALLFLLIATVTIGMSDIPHNPEQNEGNELKLLVLYGIVLVPVLLFVVIPAIVRWCIGLPVRRRRKRYRV